MKAIHNDKSRFNAFTSDVVTVSKKVKMKAIHDRGQTGTINEPML